MNRSIDVTVAAVVESDGRYLVVEEHAFGQVVFNQPAGHLEPGESLLDAVVRETREETGYELQPRYLLGTYLWHSDAAQTSFLRVAFFGAAVAPAGTPQLDDGIVAVHWFSRNQLLSRSERLRSPMVLRCIDDYAAGIRYPLDALTYIDDAARGHVRLA